MGMWMIGVSIPSSHRIPPVDTRIRSLGSMQKGSQGPLLEAQESPGRTQVLAPPYPTLSLPSPSHPQTQSRKPTWQAWGKRSAPPTASTWTHK